MYDYQGLIFIKVAQSFTFIGNECRSVLDKSTEFEEKLFLCITKQTRLFPMPYPFVGLQSLPLQEPELLPLLMEALP